MAATAVVVVAGHYQCAESCMCILMTILSAIQQFALKSHTCSAAQRMNIELLSKSESGRKPMHNRFRWILLNFVQTLYVYIIFATNLQIGCNLLNWWRWNGKIKKNFGQGFEMNVFCNRIKIALHELYDALVSFFGVFVLVFTIGISWPIFTFNFESFM